MGLSRYVIKKNIRARPRRRKSLVCKDLRQFTEKGLELLADISDYPHMGLFIYGIIDIWDYSYMFVYRDCPTLVIPITVSGQRASASTY